MSWRLSFALAVTIGFLAAIPREAYAAPRWLINVHVTTLQSTYLPGQVHFAIDTGDTLCGANTARSNLWWSNPNTDNVKGVYASLLAATVSGKNVTLVYDDTTYTSHGPTDCLISFVYVNSL
jgi:hypothetical protein